MSESEANATEVANAAPADVAAAASEEKENNSKNDPNSRGNTGEANDKNEEQATDTEKNTSTDDNTTEEKQQSAPKEQPSPPGEGSALSEEESPSNEGNSYVTEEEKKDETDAGGSPNAEKNKPERKGRAGYGGKGKGKRNASLKKLPAVKQREHQETPDTLTKRIQKLALERQKLNNRDRLKVIQSDQASHLSSVKTFQELNLPPHLLEAVFSMGFDRPSAIQEEALPRILADPPHNLIGQAQSGSGKTAAFTIGMLYRIEVDEPATTQALCVTPTRELAVQIFQYSVTPMSCNMKGLKIQLALAGEMKDQGSAVEAHIVIGTPGKVVYWLKKRTINAEKIKVFVLDEADQMVDEGGHRANSLLIKKQLPKKCQCLLFSATFPKKVVDFAAKMIHNPDKILIEKGPEDLVLDVIKQLWIDTREYPGGKREFLADIYSLLTIGQSIVFVRTKREADEVHRILSEGGYSCSILHGQVENKERDLTMESFRKGESNVLITTNVLARGVDVENVCLVVNYDVPVDKDGEPDYETYLHRIGRTGRFGRKGTAINLISDQPSLEVLAQIEAYFSTGGKEMIQNTAADPEALAESIEI